MHPSINRDYVRGMWMIMQHEKCDDFVLASGTCVSIRCIAEKVFALLGMRIKWKVQHSSSFRSYLILIMLFNNYYYPAIVYLHHLN